MRAHGHSGTVRVGTRGWRDDPTAAPTLPCAVDTLASGVTSRLSVPGRQTVLCGPGGRQDPATGTSLHAGEYLLAVDGAIETLVRFEGPARLRDGDGPLRADGGTRTRSNGGGIELVFEEPSPVTVGFRERDPLPPTVTVPESPAGVATALTHASAGLQTLSPARSHPDEREHPPLVAFGARDVPSGVRRATPESGIEFVGPPSYDWLVVIAPLAYYLGATVRVEADRERPRLLAPSADIDRALPAMPALADETATLFRRTFLLDCLARERAPDRLEGRDLLGDLGLDGGALRRQSPAERLATHLEAPFEQVAQSLPAWPLAMYVDPGAEAALELPHLLARLSLVFPAVASELEGETLLRRAVEGFRRGCGAAGNVADVDRLEPELQPDARLHGWLAGGTPIEAFESTRTAYWNALAADAGAPGLDIAVVCNDPEMRAEQCVVERYRDGAVQGVDVTVREGLCRRELAAVFERPHDMVHYVGHCEREGLRCANGYLAAADLETVRARTFVLNACGSYHEGRELIRRGSVAGAVTLTTVLDNEATTVGRTLAWLLSEGYGFERALSLARREIMMGTDYTVVGDGTHALVPPADEPALLRVTGRDEDGYEVRCERGSAAAPGRTAPDPFGEDRQLNIGTARTKLDRQGLLNLLEGWSGPVLREGRLWSAAELRRAVATGTADAPTPERR